jgi:hypothetical protein
MTAANLLAMATRIDFDRFSLRRENGKWRVEANGISVLCSHDARGNQPALVDGYTRSRWPYSTTSPVPKILEFDDPLEAWAAIGKVNGEISDA